MEVIFTRKIRKLGNERLINIPEEIQDFNAGDKVKITVSKNSLLITKEVVE